MARHKCYSIPLIRRQVPIKVPSPATLMMTERGVNTLHYASSLSGVTRSGEFRRADLSPRDGFIWIRINNSLSNLKENNDQNRDFSALQRTFYFAWQEIGLKLNLEISMAEKKKSLLSKWAYIVFWYLKSAGRGEVSNSDWKLYCRQNNSIAVHRLVICLNRRNNSSYIHSN